MSGTLRTASVDVPSLPASNKYIPKFRLVRKSCAASPECCPPARLKDVRLPPACCCAVCPDSSPVAFPWAYMFWMFPSSMSPKSRQKRLSLPARPRIPPPHPQRRPHPPLRRRAPGSISYHKGKMLGSEPVCAKPR